MGNLGIIECVFGESVYELILELNGLQDIIMASVQYTNFLYQRAMDVSLKYHAYMTLGTGGAILLVVQHPITSWWEGLLTLTLLLWGISLVYAQKTIEAMGYICEQDIEVLLAFPQYDDGNGVVDMGRVPEDKKEYIMSLAASLEEGPGNVRRFSRRQEHFVFAGGIVYFIWHLGAYWPLI